MVLLIIIFHSGASDGATVDFWPSHEENPSKIIAFYQRLIYQEAFIPLLHQIVLCPSHFFSLSQIPSKRFSLSAGWILCIFFFFVLNPAKLCHHCTHLSTIELAPFHLLILDLLQHICTEGTKDIPTPHLSHPLCKSHPSAKTP